MTKNSSNSDLESFVSSLDESKIEPQLKDIKISKEKAEMSFAGNVIEVHEEREIRTKSEPSPTEYFDDITIKNLSLLKMASQIFSQNFFTFCRINFVVSSGFLLSIFGLLFWQESSIPDIKSVLQNPKHDGVLFAASILLFWIFFSWLRTSYTTISSNYFDETESRSPLIYGGRRIFSFLVLEIMQIVLLLIGSLLVFLAPFFGARYFIGLPIMIESDEDAITSLLLSAKLAGFWMLKVMNSMIFISFFVVVIIGSLYFGLKELINNQLILLSLISFIFSFFVLPIHSCFRFVLYKKLQSLTGSSGSENFSAKRKISFALSRLTILAALLSLIAIFVTGTANNRSSLSIDALMSNSGLSSFFGNLLDTTGQYSTTTDH